MATRQKIVVNDSEIMAVVVLRNAQNANKREEIFIQPFSRAAIGDHLSIDPITFNNHPRVKVM